MARKKERQIDHVAGLGREFGWSESEVQELIKLVQNKAQLYELVRELNRPIVEIVVMLDDLLRENNLNTAATLVIVYEEGPDGAKDKGAAKESQPSVC